MEEFVGCHIEERFDVAKRKEHPQQQEDALTIVVSRKRRHEEIADRSLRLPEEFGSATIEVGATERSHGVVDLKAIHTKDLDRATQAQSPKCGGGSRLLQPEGCLQDVAGFGLIERNVAETERCDCTTLVVIVALEHVSQDQLLGGLDDVRPFLECGAEPNDFSIVIFGRDLQRVLCIERQSTRKLEQALIGRIVTSTSEGRTFGGRGFVRPAEKRFCVNV